MPFVSMAPAVSGTIASSSEYNKVVANVNQLNTTRTKYKRAVGSNASDTVTTSTVDLAGATISVTTTETNTQLRISAVFDVESSANSDTFVGSVVVDGVAQVSEAHFRSAGRSTCNQEWLVTLAAAGAHTVKLQFAKVGNTTSMIVYGPHSCVLVEGQGIS